MNVVMNVALWKVKRAAFVFVQYLKMGTSPYLKFEELIRFVVCQELRSEMITATNENKKVTLKKYSPLLQT